MKISVEKVQILKKSCLVEMYKKVMIEANKSGDSKRIVAAKMVEESRLKLVKFFEAAKKWNQKRGNYIVPTSDFPVVDAVSNFIKPNTIFTKVIYGRNKSR